MHHFTLLATKIPHMIGVEFVRMDCSRQASRAILILYYRRGAMVQSSAYPTPPSPLSLTFPHARSGGYMNTEYGNIDRESYKYDATHKNA